MRGRHARFGFGEEIGYAMDHTKGGGAWSGESASGSTKTTRLEG
jgi:hypothetical protein